MCANCNQTVFGLAPVYKKFTSMLERSNVTVHEAVECVIVKARDRKTIVTPNRPAKDENRFMCIKCTRLLRNFYMSRKSFMEAMNPDSYVGRKFIEEVPWEQEKRPVTTPSAPCWSLLETIVTPDHESSPSSGSSAVPASASYLTSTNDSVQSSLESSTIIIQKKSTPLRKKLEKAMRKKKAYKTVANFNKDMIKKELREFLKKTTLSKTFEGTKDLPDFQILEQELCATAPNVSRLLTIIGNKKGNRMNPKILSAFCILLFSRSNIFNRFQKGIACILCKCKATQEVKIKLFK